MKRTPIQPILSHFPEQLHPLFSAPVYDSSCSPEARVWYLEAEGGCFLKTAPKGALAAEASMNRYFHQKGLGPEVLDYFSQDTDWLLTRRIPGEDCTHELYLTDPQRLCETTAQTLRRLHDLPAQDCPVKDRMDAYYTKAKQGYESSYWEPELFQGQWDFATPDEAWYTLEANHPSMKNDTLLHGDYCLPNILLDNWRFSGFIDLGNGGLGDRHMDILWGIWTLQFNLHTNAYAERFMDAYGRDRIDPDLLRTAAALEIFNRVGG